MIKDLIKGKKGKILLVVGVFLIILLIGFATLTIMGKAKDPNYKETIRVEIPQGAGSSYIAAILKEEGVIDNAFAFKVYSKLKFADGKMQAGIYELTPADSIGVIVDKLKKGDVGGTMTTIPEGLTIKEMADIFDKAGIVAKEDFLNAVSTGTFDYYFMDQLPKSGETRLEGFLYPDSYKFPKDANPHFVVDSMLKRFDEMFDKNHKEKLEKSGKTLLEIVTMASIIEEEAGLDEDRPKVASVFYNRLEAGMNLGSDVTVNYITGKIGAEPNANDLAIDSPYNTRKNLGLPPGPICSPGEKSINAALEPAKTDYLFFVVEGEGTLKIVFTKTLAEHEEAVRKYRESFK